jgi:hypothetical protein
VKQEQEPACSFHKRAHGAATALAEDDVAFPVTGDGAVLSFGRSLGNHDHAL